MDKVKKLNLDIIVKANDLLSKINNIEHDTPGLNEKRLNLFRECCDLFSKDSELFRSTYYKNEKKLNNTLIEDRQIENMKLLLNKTIDIHTELLNKIQHQAKQAD